MLEPPGSSLSPALARGLGLLGVLHREGACSLDRIARVTGWPKPSLLRLLRCLAEHGAVQREESDRRWRAVLHLAPPADDEQDLIARCGPAARRLADRVQQTVELHRVISGRIVMIDRSDPVSADEVAVRARIGSQRDGTEVEALSIIAWAQQGLPMPSDPWEWVDGQRRAVSAADLRRRIASSARTGLAADRGPNPRGVRRFAARILAAGGQLGGILCIARAAAPKPGAADRGDLQQLDDIARTLCLHVSATMRR